jgi:DNA-directed RNA polymerase specialized sigma24 family protein
VPDDDAVARVTKAQPYFWKRLRRLYRRNPRAALQAVFKTMRTFASDEPAPRPAPSAELNVEQLMLVEDAKSIVCRIVGDFNWPKLPRQEDAAKEAEDLEDAVEAEARWRGREGLVYAAQTWDPVHGVPFRAYARQAVRWRVLDYWRTISRCSSVEVKRQRELTWEEAQDAHTRRLDARVMVFQAWSRVFAEASQRELSGLRKERELLRLLYAEDQPIPWIAAGWGLSANEVETIKRRAFARLRPLLDDNADEDALRLAA